MSENNNHHINENGQKISENGNIEHPEIIPNQSNLSEKKQSEQIKMNGHQIENSDENLEKPSQQKNQNSQQTPKSSGQQSQQRNDQQQDKSSINDQNKFDRDDQQDDSNLKSDDKDDQQQNSGDDIKKQQPSGKKCFNKQCSSKKIYKKLRSKVQHAKYRFLCKPCYQNYCDNNFCEFCEQIYSNTGNTQDDDQWIGCDSCNRWNHIECEKKYRNKNIHQIKDQNIIYLCLTCSYNHKNSGLESKQRVKDQKLPQKQRPQICKDQRIPIFNKKIQNLPSLQYFLQNYNFRLWINQNLIKDDIETLRAAQKRYTQEQFKKNKKIKLQ